MNHTRSGNIVEIVLSERNVEHLMEAYKRGYAMGLRRLTEDGTSLHIRVESNEDHYKDREAGPGLEPVIK